MVSDPWQGTALRNAMQDEPVNAGHRFEVATLDTNYYADEVVIDPMTGYPAWRVANDVPHGKIRYCRPSNFRAVGRDRRKAIIEMLQHEPLTTAQIREKLGGTPYHYLNELHKNGKIGHKCIWAIK